MYTMDGIAYPGHPGWVKHVIYAQYMGERVIRVAMNTGEVVDVDFSHDFDGNIFRPLKDENVLRDFTVAHGVLTWQDETIDVSPEYLMDVGTLIEGPVPEL